MRKNRQVIARLSVTSLLMLIFLLALTTYCAIRFSLDMDILNHPENALTHNDLDGTRNRSTLLTFLIYCSVIVAVLLAAIPNLLFVALSGFEHLFVEDGFLIVNGIAKRRIDIRDIRSAEFTRASDQRTFGTASPDIIEIRYAPARRRSGTRVLRIASLMQKESSYVIAMNLRQAGVDVAPRAATIQKHI